MFHKVLVPVDLTDRHLPALEIAGKLAGPAGGEVILIHVIELLHGMSREEEPAFYERLERKAAGHLAGLVARLQAQQAVGRSAIRLGERVPEILRYAQQEGVDLIVLSSHAIDPEKPGAGWATMSYLIGIAARCPVLLVK
jgi:nucleotide-binding universal stress UspA family protein